jgi:hypothetical protein
MPRCFPRKRTMWYSKDERLTFPANYIRTILSIVIVLIHIHSCYIFSIMIHLLALDQIYVVAHADFQVKIENDSITISNNNISNNFIGHLINDVE